MSGCSIYTSCYPCPMCMGAILWANINQIYYANTKEDADSIGFKDAKLYDVIASGKFDNIKLEQMDRDEAIKVFRDYEKNSLKVEY